MQKDRKRWGKTAAILKNTVFIGCCKRTESLTSSPAFGGRGLYQMCGLDFVSELAEGSVYAWLREFLVKSFIVLA
jgi:hypothetical protein